MSRRERKEMKSAHSFTLSNDCRLLSTWSANFLYRPSLARSDAAAANVSGAGRAPTACGAAPLLRRRAPRKGGVVGVHRDVRSGCFL